MSNLPSVLEQIITDWGREISKLAGYPVSPWKELSVLTGRAPSTLRSYCDEFNPVYPPVDVLLAICKATGRDEPLRLIESFRKGYFGEEK